MVSVIKIKWIIKAAVKCACGSSLMIAIKKNEIKDYNDKKRERERISWDFFYIYFIFIFTTSFTLSLAQKQLMAGITIYIFMTHSYVWTKALSSSIRLKSQIIFFLHEYSSDVSGGRQSSFFLNKIYFNE